MTHENTKYIYLGIHNCDTVNDSDLINDCY